MGPILPRLPPLSPPALGLHDAAGLLGAAASLFVVVLAQGAATSRAYVAKHRQTISADADLVGLRAANIAAAFTGTFAVNGSPTQTQLVDSAGGRSQLAQLAAAAVLVLLFAIGPLAFLPIGALAAVVFLIGLRLINVRGMRGPAGDLRHHRRSRPEN